MSDLNYATREIVLQDGKGTSIQVQREGDYHGLDFHYIRERRMRIR